MEVTIGIPVFNCEQWIATAIRSALAQTWSQKEVIVVDDGSTDQTGRICAEFSDQIHYVRQSNRGGNAARNRILELARGEWIQYLDADDYLKPQKIASQLTDCIDIRNQDVLCSPTVCETWRDGNVVGSRIIPLEKGVDLRVLWLSWNMPQTGACLWRAATLKRLGGWDETLKRNQDTELHARAFRNRIRYQVCGEPLSIWRNWSDSTVSNQSKVLLFRHMADLVHDFLNWLEREGECTVRYRQIGGQLCFKMARDLARIDLSEADRFFQEYSRKGLMHVTEPWAPPRYRLVLNALGFKNAERLASFLRARA